MKIDAQLEKANAKILEEYLQGKISAEEFNWLMSAKLIALRILSNERRDGVVKKSKVLIGIIVIFLTIIGWDVYLYMDGVAGNSISQVIIELSEKSMLVPWFIGLLMGFLGAHFFDNYKEPRI